MKRRTLKQIAEDSGYKVKTLESWVSKQWLLPVSVTDDKPNSTRYYTMQSVFEAERRSLEALEEAKPKKAGRKVHTFKPRGKSGYEQVCDILGTKPRANQHIH